jgi:hypothetical protein
MSNLSVEKMMQDFDESYSNNRPIMPTEFIARFKKITGKKLSGGFDNDVIDGYYEIVSPYIDLINELNDAHELSLDQDITVEITKSRITGNICLYESCKIYKTINNLLVNTSVWHFYRRNMLPNFDIIDFIKSLTPFEVSSFLITNEINYDSIDKNILILMMACCDPYLFGISIKTPAVHIINDKKNKVLFEIFTEYHVKDSFDLMKLYHHCRDYGYNCNRMRTLYEKFISSAEEFPELYDELTSQIISSNDTGAIESWFEKYKCPKDAKIITLNELSYKTMQIVARHTNINNVRNIENSLYVPLREIKHKNNITLLYRELMYENKDIDKIRFLLYHAMIEYKSLDNCKIMGEPLIIFIASCTNDHNLLLMLKEYNIDWQAKCSKGHNALYYACCDGNNTLIDILVEQGLTINFPTDKINKSTLSYCKEKIARHHRYEQKSIDTKDYDGLSQSHRSLVSIMTNSKSSM